MNLEAEKLVLLEKIIKSNDEALIFEVQALFNEQNHDSDWFEHLDSNSKNDILEGIRQADNGEFVSNNEVKKTFEKWNLK